MSCILLKANPSIGFANLFSISYQYFLLLFFILFSGSVVAQNDLNSVESYILENSDREYQMTYQTITNMQRQSAQRAESYANELANYSSISNSNDPARVLDEYRNQMQQMEQMIEQRNEQLTMQGFDVVERVSGWGDNTSQQEFYGGLQSGISYLEERSAAKKAAAAQRAKLQREKQRAMNSIRENIVTQNNELIREYVSKAAYALNKDEEDFYLELAYYFTGHNNYINENFSYNTTNWAANPYQEPSEPKIIPNNLKSKYEKYIEAAQRKNEYFLKFKKQFPSLNEAAVKFANGAIHEKKTSAEPYLLLADITRATDLNTSYSSLLIAQRVNKSAFNAANGPGLLSSTKAQYAAAFKRAALNDDYEFIQKGLQLGLHKGLKLEGKNPMFWAIAEDIPDLVQVLINKDVEENGRDSKKLAGMMALASYKNADAVVQRLIKLGVSPDAAYGKVEKPIIIASRAGSLEALNTLMAATNNKEEYELFFSRRANAKYALGYYQIKLLNALNEDAYSESEALLNWFSRNNKMDEAVITVVQIAQKRNRHSVIYTLKPFSAQAKGKVANDLFLEAVLINDNPLIAQAIYAQGITEVDLRCNSSLSLSSEKRKVSSSLTKVKVGSSSLIKEDDPVQKFQEVFSNGTAQNQSSTSNSGDYDRKVNSIRRQSKLKNEVLAKIIAMDMHEILTDLYDKKIIADNDLNTLADAIVLAEAANCLDRLPRMGYDFATTDEDGYTLLHKAVYLEAPNLVTTILSNKPGLLNAKGKYDWTPLHFASRQGSAAMVGLLTSRNANTKAEDQWGRTPKDIAKEYLDNPEVNEQDFKNVIELL